MVEKSCAEEGGRAGLAVDLYLIELSRPAQDALFFPPHAGNDALRVVNVAAFELKGRFALKAYAADVGVDFRVETFLLPQPGDTFCC
jgi:hypothetical protein